MFNKNKIEMNEIYKFGIASGIGQIVYILLVVLIMTNITKLMKPPAEILSGLMMLLLFVFSAAISGLIVFGYPAYLALQNKFQQAVLTVAVTLLTLLTGFLAILLVMFII